MSNMVNKDRIRDAILASGALEEIQKLGKDHLRNAIIELMVERQIMRLELKNYKDPQIIIPH